MNARPVRWMCAYVACLLIAAPASHAMLVAQNIDYNPISSINFGTVQVGSFNTFEFLRIRNEGAEPIVWDDALTTSPSLNPFNHYLAAGPCSSLPGSGTLDPLDECVYRIEFYPYAVGDFTGQFTFTGRSANGEEQVVIDLLGTAVTVVPVPAAVWLFGFGLIGLIGVARRNKGSK